MLRPDIQDLLNDLRHWASGIHRMLCNYNIIRRYWKKTVGKVGLLGRNIHDMRHNYATLRLSNGDSLHEVSKEMGHSSTNITYSTYYKWLPKESGSNIDNLDAPKRTYMQPEKIVRL